MRNFRRFLLLLDRFWGWIVFPFVWVLILWFHGGNTKDRWLSIIWSDAEGYYLYLPATLVEGSWEKWDGQKGLQAISCCPPNERGILKDKYTYGVALMEAPFFLMAHGLATWIGSNPPTPPPPTLEPSIKALSARQYSPLRGAATGFSDYYLWGLTLGAALYLTAGLYFLKETLKRTYSRAFSTAIACLILGATNLLYYGTKEIGMSHLYSFFLFSLFLYLLSPFLNKPTWGKSALLGGVLAHIVLIRPTNILLGLALLGWDSFTLNQIRQRGRWLARHWYYFLLWPCFLVLIYLPQFLYWKNAFGAGTTWSYGDEGFTNWLTPRFFQVLFHWQNGLFLYTPVLLLSAWGIWVGKKEGKGQWLLSGILWVTITYVFASWWAWWFGGAFGHRCYVEWYALLAWPLAEGVGNIWKSRKQWKKQALFGALAFFTFVNIRMTILYYPPWDGPNWVFKSYLGIWRRVLDIFHLWG